MRIWRYWQNKGEGRMAWLREKGGWLLLGLGAIFLTIGVMRGEHLAVMEKAIRICLECIGIG